MRDMIIFKTKKRLLLKACTVLALAALVFILPPAACLAEVSDALEGPFTLTVGLGNNDNKILEDLRSEGVVIDLYKIADAKKLSGYDAYEFTAKTKADGSVDKTYESLSNEDLISISNHDITGEQWEELAQKAAKIVLDPDQGIAVQTTDQELTGKSVESPVSIPSAGLYLLVARGKDSKYVDQAKNPIVTYVNSSGYKYSFLPQLIAFPSKTADENGIINTANTGDWIKDININLKYGFEPRKGELDIIKGLDVFETKDPATFTFKVEGKDNNNKLVFSNSYNMVFNSPGEQKKTIKNIPIGTIVTVTEAYSGNNYKVTSGDSKTVTIKAADVAKTEFKNTYNNTYKGGGSIENVFTKKGDGWKWYGIDEDGNKYETTENKN